MDSSKGKLPAPKLAQLCWRRGITQEELTPEERAPECDQRVTRMKLIFPSQQLCKHG